MEAKSIRRGSAARGLRSPRPRAQGTEVDRNASSHRQHIEMLEAELMAQRDSYASRSTSMNTRLSVLIAAASLVSGLQVSAHQAHVWYIVGAALAAAAAVCGIIALWPRRGDENGIEALRDELWAYSGDYAAYVLLNRQLEILKQDESTLNRRARWAAGGFSLLTLSIVAVTLQVIGVP